MNCAIGSRSHAAASSGVLGPQRLGLPAPLPDECRGRVCTLLVGDLDLPFQPAGVVADLARDAVEDAVGEQEILLLDCAPEHLFALPQPH